MLYWRESWLSDGPEADIALDPLEGTTLCAKAITKYVAVIAVSSQEECSYDTYIDKIAIGLGIEDTISLDAAPADNGSQSQKKKELILRNSVCILDRERHTKHIDSVRSTEGISSPEFKTVM